jgi:leader peptidase (prepilin peptidase)/N-methyltransferase
LAPAKIILGAILFGLGTSLGSFLNVCIYRLPLDKSIVSPPSHCPSCGTRLSPPDLVPIFSYLALRGRCRYCGARISPRYAVVEFLTGAWFVALYLRFGVFGDFRAPEIFTGCQFAVFSAMLIAIFFIDLDHYIIPDQFSLGGAACGLAFGIAGLALGLRSGYMGVRWLPDAIPGMFLGLAVFALIISLGSRVFKKEAMGMGDLKLAAAMGANLGVASFLLATFLGVLIGTLVSVVLMIGRRKGLRDLIPFGPMLVVGTMVAMIWGPQIIAAYRNWAGI